jgi:hypothetical protein
MNDEFYIGWQSRAPAGIGSRVRKAVVALLLLVVASSCILALAQQTIGVAVFEWGTVKTFRGVLQTRPYPHLLLSRPGQGGGQSAYYLVAPFKFGLSSEAIAGFEGKPVSLKGTLIYRDNQTMIEVRPESIREASPADQQARGFNSVPSADPHSPLVTLVGEIVDSKCYLGVMNPGNLAPHRDCAVRCISGGIPPVFLVHGQAGRPLYFLLVSKEGRPVNKQVLDMVAEPLEITGQVIRQGELAILRADPETYRRIAK